MPIVIAFMIAVAAFMGWQALQPQCPGGATVVDEASCRANFDADFCRQALPAAQRSARISGETFKSQAECLDQWPICIERSDVSAWAPKPASWCVARAPGGGIARIEPVYSKR